MSYTVSDTFELDAALGALRELPALRCVRITALEFSLAPHQVCAKPHQNKPC